MGNDRIPTLFDWAGGLTKFETLFKTFYDKVLKDELLGELFKDMPSEHVNRVAHFVAEVFGGPNHYSVDEGGSHARMIGKHIGKMLTEEKRKRWMTLLAEAADEIGLKTDPEFRSSFVGYFEWGSRIAVMNSHLTENPTSHSEPMPKWGWGETHGPYQGKP